MHLLTLLIFVFSTLLSGCSSSFRSEESRCIKTALVSSLSQMPLSHFIKEDSRMVTISAFKAGCGGSSPDLPGGYNDIGINVTLKIPDAHSPKDNVTEITLPLFVALLNRQDDVLDRQDESINLKVSDYALSKTYKITYHPPEGIDPTSANHKILMGFNQVAIKDPSPKRSVHQSVKKKVFHKKKLKNKKKQIKRKRLYKHIRSKQTKKRPPKSRRVKAKKTRRWR